MHPSKSSPSVSTLPKPGGAPLVLTTSHPKYFRASSQLPWVASRIPQACRMRTTCDPLGFSHTPSWKSFLAKGKGQREATVSIAKKNKHVAKWVICFFFTAGVSPKKSSGTAVVCTCGNEVDKQQINMIKKAWTRRLNLVGVKTLAQDPDLPAALAYSALRRCLPSTVILRGAGERRTVQKKNIATTAGPLSNYRVQ